MNLSKKMFCNHSNYKTTHISKALRKSILALEVPHKTKYFVAVYYKRYGKIITDIIAVKKATKETEVALRLIEGCLPLASPNLYCNWMAGYSYNFKGLDNKQHDYYENKLIELGDGVRLAVPNIGYYEDIDLINWEEDEQLKYLANYKVEIFNCCTYLSEFVTYLRVEPKIELLVKAGIPQYFKEYRKFRNYKLNAKRLEIIKEYGLTITELKSIERRGISPDNYIFIRQFRKRFSNTYDFELHQSIYAWNYIEPHIVQHIDKIKNLLNKYQDIYIDTIKLAVKAICLGVDIDIKNYLLIDGRDLKDSHNNLLELTNQLIKEREEAKAAAEIEKEAKKNEKLFKIAKKFNNKIDNDNYEIKFNVLNSLQEFFITGETLNHCVYRMHYYDKVIKDQILIINAMVDDKITETLEVNLENKTIVQCRGKNNLDSEFHLQILEQAEQRILSVI